MPHKERWFRDRIVTAFAPRTAHEKHAAVLPVRTPMLVKERWFKSRVFAAAAAGPLPSPRYAGGAILPKGGGRQQIGKPYKVANRWFTPREQPGYDRTGIASWYGSAFHRRMTSNGEWFDMEYFSAAHPTLPLPSYVKVTNIDNGSEIIVRVNDRGPFSGGRIIDVSKKCAEALGFKDRGTATVRVRYMGAAPLDDGGSHLRAVNRELRHGTAFERILATADIAVRTLAAVDATPRHAF
jgi:rare lipoprotein A